jgi:hypothetical protein
MPLLSVASSQDQDDKQLPVVVLLCSANRKFPHPAPALDLYRSEFFQLGKAFAQQMEPDLIFVLSAEHGLVPAEQELQPYTMTMSALGKGDVKGWGKLVVEQLKDRLDLSRYQIVILGLGRFAYPIAHHLVEARTPLAQMSLSGALNFLRQQVGDEASRKD